MHIFQEYEFWNFCGMTRHVGSVPELTGERRIAGSASVLMAGPYMTHLLEMTPLDRD